MNIRHLACALFAATCVGACGVAPSAEENASVDAAVQAFYDLQSSGQDEQIYENAATEFQAAGPVDTLKRINTFVRAIEGCGPATKTPQFNWNRSLAGFFATNVYARECRPGTLIETFTFKVENGEAKLVTYNIGGMAMFPLLEDAE